MLLGITIVTATNRLGRFFTAAMTHGLLGAAVAHPPVDAWRTSEA
jgi:hypothetical protein